MVDAELPGRVDGDELEGLVRVDAPVANRLRRLGVHAAGELRRIGVEGDQHADIVHEGAVVGNRVHHLDLVRPPVAERAGARAVGGDGVGHLVALEHVLEGPHGEAELVGEADEHEDLVLAVAVAVNDALAVEDLDERVELQVAPGRHGPYPLVGAQGEVAIQPRPVLAGGDEGIADDRLDTHAGVGVAALGALDVLAERELDSGDRVVDAQVVGGARPAELDHAVLAPDGVRRAVQQVGDGETSGELPVPVDVVGVDHVADADLGADRLRPLVDAAADAGMRMAVDEAGGQVLAGGVDHLGIGRRVEPGGLPDVGEPAAADEDGGVVDDPRRPGGPHRRAHDGHGATPRGLGQTEGPERVNEVLGRQNERVIVLGLLLGFLRALVTVRGFRGRGGLCFGGFRCGVGGLGDRGPAARVRGVGAIVAVGGFCAGVGWGLPVRRLVVVVGGGDGGDRVGEAFAGGHLADAHHL